jgi:hypothetical protein
MRRAGAPSPWLAALALAALLAAGPAAAELWRWIDADGVPRYTPDPDRVPGAQRATLARVEPGMAAAPPPSVAPPPAPAAATPPEIFAPPVEEPLAEDPFNAPERAREAPGEIVGEVVVELPEAAPRAAPSPAPSAATASLPPVDAPAPPAAAEATAPVEEPPAATETARAPSPASPHLEARRAELLAAIARDEAALRTHVASSAGGPLAASPELREIAERLPALQAELRALEAQTAAP